MNKQDQELIEKYLHYVRKRRIVTVTSILIIILVSGFIFNLELDIPLNDVQSISVEETIEVQENEIVTNNILNVVNTNVVEKEAEKPMENKSVIAENKKTTVTSKPTSTILSNNEEVKVEKTKPANKDFLFEDGYTMYNVIEEAHKYLKSSECAGECIPLKDDEGIYIGMRVIFY